MSTSELDLSQPLVCSACGSVYRDGHHQDTCNKYGCNKKLIPLVAFISYRREIAGRDGVRYPNVYAEIISKSIVERLRNALEDGEIPLRGDVFFDRKGMESGNFESQLLTIIERLRNRFFILILTAGALDKRDDPRQDWMRREIAHAVEHKLKFLILEIRDDKSGSFQWPQVSEDDPHYEALKFVEPLHRVPYIHGVETVDFNKLVISPIVHFLRDLGFKSASDGSGSRKPIEQSEEVLREDPPSATKASDVAHNRFADEVRQALETDGDITPNDQRHLVGFGAQEGLSAAQSLAIIKEVLESEKVYLQVIREVLEDGKISSIEQKILANKAAALGISPVRASQLLQQESKSLPSKVAESSVEALPNGQNVAGADDGGDSDWGGSDDEPPWEYFALGNMTVGQVLESPESEDLAGYIAFYAIGDVEDTAPILAQLKAASPSALIKDVVESYVDFLDADTVGGFSVSDARAWSLGRVIKNLVNDLSLDEVHCKRPANPS
jgi:hypothetical protein